MYFRVQDYNANDVVFKYKGEQFSKNQYFFPETKQNQQVNINFIQRSQKTTQKAAARLPESLNIT